MPPGKKDPRVYKGHPVIKLTAFITTHTINSICHTHDNTKIGVATPDHLRTWARKKRAVTSAVYTNSDN